MQWLVSCKISFCTVPTTLALATLGLVTCLGSNQRTWVLGRPTYKEQFLGLAIIIVGLTLFCVDENWPPNPACTVKNDFQFNPLFKVKATSNTAPIPASASLAPLSATSSPRPSSLRARTAGYSNNKQKPGRPKSIHLEQSPKADNEDDVFEDGTAVKTHQVYWSMITQKFMMKSFS